MRQSVSAILLAALLAIGSVGCGGDATDESNQGDTSEIGTEEQGSDSKAVDE